MNHLLESFRKHQNERGCHFYDQESCNFLSWSEVIRFANKLPGEVGESFSEKLVEALSNYDPQKEFLAVHQKNSTVSVEIYSHASRGRTV